MELINVKQFSLREHLGSGFVNVTDMHIHADQMYRIRLNGHFTQTNKTLSDLTIVLSFTISFYFVHVLRYLPLRFQVPTKYNGSEQNFIGCTLSIPSAFALKKVSDQKTG